jgi:hypothetical protein
VSGEGENLIVLTLRRYIGEHTVKLLGKWFRSTTTSSSAGNNDRIRILERRDVKVWDLEQILNETAINEQKVTVRKVVKPEQNVVCTDSLASFRCNLETRNYYWVYAICLMDGSSEDSKCSIF